MQNWEYKKLGDVCDIINGKNQKEVLDENGAYPIYGSGGVMGYANDFLCRENTIIIGRKGSINNPIFVEEKFWNVDTAFGLQSKDNYLPKLLFYFCKGFDFTTHNKGTTIPSLVKSDLLQIPIPLPPLEEQKRIVKILDEKFAQLETVKANAKANLQNAKDLFQSQLTKLLETSKENKVVDLFDIRTGKLNSNEAVPNGKYPFFTCSREIFAIDSYAFDCDAILLAGNNASGDFNVKHYCGKFNAYQRTYVLTVKNKETTEIRLLYYVLENYLKKLKNMSVGANTRFLKLGMIQNLDYPNCSLPEQKRIVEQLDSLSEKVRSLEEIYTKQLANCDELKQAFLVKAFNVEL